MNNLENKILLSKLSALIEDLSAKNIFVDYNVNEDKEQSFAFLVYSISRFLENYNIDEIMHNITEGGNDQGIDACHIDEDDSNITINLFQSKFKSIQRLNGTIGENDINHFLSKVEEIFIKGNPRNLPMNLFLQRQYDRFQDICKLKNLNNISVNLFFITNGADLAQQEQDILKNFKQQNSLIDKAELLNQYSFFVDNQKEDIEPIEIVIDGNYMSLNDGINAYVVNIKANELQKLYQRFGDAIFNKNVRGLLKKSTINKEIMESAQSAPNEFWYKNNGLSIICSTVNKGELNGQTSLSLVEPYIANGGQTTRALAQLWNNLSDDDEMSKQKKHEIFAKVKIMAKVYQTTNPNAIYSIAKGTNNQNPITLFDLKSLNPKLKTIKDFFETKDVSLLIKRDANEARMERAVNADTLLQFYCAIYIEIPDKAKNSKTKLINNYYDEVYSNLDNSYNLLESYLWYEALNTYKKMNANSEHLGHSDFAMVYLAKKIIDAETSLSKDNALKRADNLIENIVKEEKARSSNFSYNNFFKNSVSTKLTKDAFEQRVKEK